MKLKVELVWEAEEGQPSSSIYLTSDGKILLSGSPVEQVERETLALGDKALIAVDRRFVEAVKTLL